MANPLIMRDAAIWVREFDLQTHMNAITLGEEFPPVECTTFGEGARSYVIGIPRVPLSAGGYPKSDVVDAGLFALAGLTNLPITVSVERAVGKIAYVGSFLDGQYTTNFSVDAVREFAMTGELSQRSFGRGRLLHLGTAVAATGNGAAQLLIPIGATFQAFVTLHITALTGTLTFTGRIESDNIVGFTTPTTVTTFTVATAPLGLTGQLKAIVGPITDMYWRFAWTIAGTGTATFAAAIGFEELI